MADAFSTNYNFRQPEVGSSNDTWGTKLNADLVAIDSDLHNKLDRDASYGITLTDLGFSSVPITSTDAGDARPFEGFEANDRIYVTGSTADDGMYVVASKTEKTLVCATTLNADDVFNRTGVTAGTNSFSGNTSQSATIFYAGRYIDTNVVSRQVTGQVMVTTDDSHNTTITNIGFLPS